MEFQGSIGFQPVFAACRHDAVQGQSNLAQVKLALAKGFALDIPALTAC
jgi:hypothetical protein